MSAEKIVLLVVEVFLVFLGIKNFNTYYQGSKISKAIHDYHVYCIYNKELGYNYNADVDYCDEEHYLITLFRVFDWGYKNILTKEKYEFIKDYIKS